MIGKSEQMNELLTGEQVAALLGTNRRTVYRWAERGVIPPVWQWRRSIIEPLIGKVQRPRKGPPRNQWSLRYTVYRHRFDEVRTGKGKGGNN